MDEIGSTKVYNKAMFLRADFTHFNFMSPRYFPGSPQDVYYWDSFVHTEFVHNLVKLKSAIKLWLYRKT